MSLVWYVLIGMACGAHIFVLGGILNSLVEISHRIDASTATNAAMTRTLGESVDRLQVRAAPLAWARQLQNYFESRNNEDRAT